MPATLKRRKVSATKSAPLNTKPLDAFTHVSKASSFTQNVIKKNNHVDTITATQLKHTTSQKRKLGISEEESAVDQVPVVLVATTNERDIKPFPQRRSTDSHNPQTPQKSIKNTTSPASIETPTKGARSLLDQFHVSSETPTRPPPSDGASIPSILKSATALPNEVLDLINMHAAFLTALSLHYAHNGTHSPADLRILCPDVSRAWGKRRVTLEDIRRSLGVMNTSIPEGRKDQQFSRLSLSDYGHGKICIENRTGDERATKLARPVNENVLNDIYVRGLKKTWERRDRIDMEMKEFVDGLPLEPITTCSSLLKMSPLLAKGQRRLEDMKAGIIIQREAAKDKASMIETSRGTKPTLLERLRARQYERMNMPQPPSKVEIDRKAALGRIDEVVAVLSILSTSSSIGQQRISFTMPTVLGKLRDSFKTPMSKQEADICVRLLASEIAPEWVKLVKMGKVEALVVNRDERPSEFDIKERVKRVS